MQHENRSLSDSASAVSDHIRAALISKPGNSNTGIGRYVSMLNQGFAGTQIKIMEVNPVLPSLLSFGHQILQHTAIDIRSFFFNYPIWANYPKSAIYHIASQNLASLLLFHAPPKPVIVTVHDIIPYMLRNNEQLNIYRTPADRLFDRIAMMGLRQADLLIAVSEYTRQCLINYLRISPERIITVRSGINQEVFRPIYDCSDVYHRYGLNPAKQYIIYVGSEDPRKNLQVLFHALSILRQKFPNIEFIKVGNPHFDYERQRLIHLVHTLGIQDITHFLNDIPDSDLALFYSTAKVCVLPSLYEGFGFPVLEAMACGLPTVVARATSLPELVGTAALLFNPNDVDDLCVQIAHLLDDENLRLKMIRQGTEHVRLNYSCPVIISQLQTIYIELMEWYTHYRHRTAFRMAR